MTAIIETKGLTKQYGTRVAVRGLDLVVERGAVFGFVGPNGAGKTTTFRMLATLLRPTAGEAYVAGYSVQGAQPAVRRAIGYMPDFFGVYGDMRVWEYLDFFASCYGLASSVRRGLVTDLLELVDLAHRREDYVDALSRGMKQRLCLARALAHDPQLLILDEPASGLDPRARVEIRELLRELQAMGKTILVSSHILSEIQEVCTHIGIVEAGELVASGTLAEMRRMIRQQRVLHMGLARSVDGAGEWLAARDGVTGVEAVREQDMERVTLTVNFTGGDDELVELLRAFTGVGYPLITCEEDIGDLEDIFMRLTRGIVS